ncbi:unnamed protein product [Coffea canephora]|uniref:Uncharacterized protein n=1 Tax=Coffea canephora TaxID=49390 RepID=A0A068UHV7_COFCA|nr:unnamed protein product [Coffea canephora]CDP17845.1 unnamed protein product [Coffea canephora]
MNYRRGQVSNFLILLQLSHSLPAADRHKASIMQKIPKPQFESKTEMTLMTHKSIVFYCQSIVFR